MIFLFLGFLAVFDLLLPLEVNLCIAVKVMK